MSDQREVDDKCLVSVLCSTYNHAPYIRQCLDGFIMQKTNFKFQVIVHDDASTDGTQDIIKEYELKYPEIIKPIYQKTNGYGSERNRRDKFNAIKGKYLAFCEGDDYWVDPLKLQKQVDFLENNPEYGLIHSDFELVNESNIIEWRISKCHDVEAGLLKAVILGKYHIGTPTVLYRRSLYEEIPKYFYERKFKMGDYPLWIELSSISKFKYLDEVTSCYRRINTSASGFNDFSARMDFIDSSIECALFYIEKFDICGLESKVKASKYLTAMKYCYQIGDGRKADMFFKEFICKYPFEISLKIVIFYFLAKFRFLRSMLDKAYKKGFFGKK